MNEYIENSAEIKAIANGEDDECRCYSFNVALDIYDKRHDLRYDIRRRAEYKNHLGLTMTMDEFRALED